jgi:hypothetical protein
VKTTFRHRDPRFTVTISHAYWGGRRQVTATVHMENWGLFYRVTRNSPKQAYRAADHAIRKYNAERNFEKWTLMQQVRS